MKIIIEIDEPENFEDTKLITYHYKTISHLWNDKENEYKPKYRTKEFQNMLHDEIYSWLENLNINIKQITFKKNEVKNETINKRK